MTRQQSLFWAPRLLGIAFAAFLGLFALDAFEVGKPLGRAIMDFVVHLLPAFVVLGVLALAWRDARIGALAFLMLAAAYAVWVGFRLDWMIAISGPLLLVAVLFMLSAGRAHAR
jgi:hypothetical protein